MTSGSVNFAGIVSCNSSINFEKLIYACFRVRTNLWILDSKASHHMNFNKQNLTNLITLAYPLLIRLPNGYRVKVTEIGTVQLALQITLHSVLFVPSFKYNLVSISCLTTHLKYVTSFSDTSYLLQAPSLKRPLDIGKVHDGL